MNIDNLIAEIEFDLEWRSEEIRFLRNISSSLTDVEERKRMRRALVVMLYAHFEGFSKFAFQVYVKLINSSECKGGDVVFPILASSLIKDIKGLSNLNQKSDIFRNTAPSDTELHLLARSIEFVERLDEINRKQIILDGDEVVNTESNLTPIVMKKILFRLGFAYDDLASVSGSIQKLLEFRNGIAHGKMKVGIEDDKYETLQNDVFNLINAVKRKVTEAIHNASYLKSAA